MKQTKTAWLSCFRKVVPADYEEWLERRAAEGWNIDRISQFSSICMVFHKTAPKTYRYIFDINPWSAKDYKQTYLQFGWEEVGQMSSCFVWRKEYTKDRPESFTDLHSLQKRNKTVRNIVFANLLVFVLAFVALAVFLGVRFSAMGVNELTQCGIGLAVALAFSLYLWWVVRKLNKNLLR